MQDAEALPRSINIVMSDCRQALPGIMRESSSTSNSVGGDSIDSGNTVTFFFSSSQHAMPQSTSSIDGNHRGNTPLSAGKLQAVQVRLTRTLQAGRTSCVYKCTSLYLPLQTLIQAIHARQIQSGDALPLTLWRAQSCIGRDLWDSTVYKANIAHDHCIPRSCTDHKLSYMLVPDPSTGT